MKNKLSSLLRIYDKLLKDNNGQTRESIEILEAIEQLLTESNEDESAYSYQQKVCDACVEVYGADSIETKRANYYCRELMIRTSPVHERVRLCREYWRDAIEEYGGNSYLVKIIAPLYLMCCSDANEIEELKIVCSEVVTYFKDNDDIDSRQLVALCSSFDCISGEKSGSIAELSKAVERADAVLGENSLMSLHFLSEIGRIYRKNNEHRKALEIFCSLYRISIKKYGKYCKDTIVFQKEYALSLALSGEYKKALSNVKKLEKAIEKCPDKNICPDVYDCYMYIYMGLGKKELSEKYANMSVKYNQKSLGNDDLTTAKARFVSAAKAFSENPANRSAFSQMTDYLSIKERWLNNMFLLSSDIIREKNFNTLNSGEYDIFLGLAVGNIEYLNGNDIQSLWEVVCNYKSLVGDCELLHSAVSRSPSFAQKENELREKIKSGNATDIADVQRQLLDIMKERDFTGYVNSVHVSEIQRSLKDGEVMLDYYCVHYSDLQIYVCLTVTSEKTEMIPLGTIDGINALTEEILFTACKKSENASPLIREMMELLHLDITEPQRIIVCPDGELYRFPFDILFPDCEIVYVTCAKDIVRTSKSTNNGKTPIKDVCIFADPIFNRYEEQNTFNPDDEQARSENLARLPGTYVEANIISHVFGGSVKQFVGENASRETFLEYYDADILHIGTHASSSGGGIIYLTGADETDSEGQAFIANCSVTSRDIAKLNMAKTKLAVLSACRTGIGEYRDYLGVRGLRRAFQLAGAESVISALWNISDIATSVFMYLFYSKYNECSDSIKSLSYAKDRMKTATVEEIKEEIYPEISPMLLCSGDMESYRAFRDMIQYGVETEIPFSSPYYWAAFTLYK